MTHKIKATTTVILTMVVGVIILCLGLALIAFGNNSDANIELSFFGQTFKSTNVGIAGIFIGGVIVVLTVRRAFKSLDHAISSGANSSISSEHMHLLSEQIALQRETRECQREKDRRQSEPVFVWRDGLQTREKMVCNFQNTGGPVRILAITSNPSCNIRWAPIPRIETNQLGWVSFEDPERLSPDYQFEISYQTTMSVQGIGRFQVNPRNDGVPREV